MQPTTLHGPIDERGHRFEVGVAGPGRPSDGDQIGQEAFDGGRADFGNALKPARRHDRPELSCLFRKVLHAHIFTDKMDTIIRELFLQRTHRLIGGLVDQPRSLPGLAAFNLGDKLVGRGPVGVAELPPCATARIHIFNSPPPSLLVDRFAILQHGLATLLAVRANYRSRLAELAQRIGGLAAQIEGSSRTVDVRLHDLTGLILYLSEVVERKSDLDIGPVLDFLKRDERVRGTGVQNTLVNLTVTMIELLPMIGILGTVWAISGVRGEDFATSRLLSLFGIAISTTLFALLYVVIFRILYSAFVEAKVTALAEHNQRFQELLSILEKRSHSIDFGVEGATDMWSKKSG